MPLNAEDSNGTKVQPKYMASSYQQERKQLLVHVVSYRSASGVNLVAALVEPLLITL